MSYFSSRNNIRPQSTFTTQFATTSPQKDHTLHTLFSKNPCKNTDSPRPFFLLPGRQIRLGKEFSEGVFGADGREKTVERFEGPGDVEGGVVSKDGAFTGRVVEVSGFVEDFGGVGENEETVGEAFGDPEELEVVVRGLGFEVKAGPFAEVGGVATEVDGDVPDVAREDADELALGFAELIVQAAKDTFDRERLIVLNELGGEAGCLKC